MKPSALSRSPLVISLAVWKALFLREALGRLAASRTAGVWLLLEPAFHIAFLMFIFGVIRVQVIGGIHTALWVMIGLLAFFMFRRPAAQAQHAVSANRALFAYRQVKPVDTVLVRAALEGLVMTLVTIVLFAAVSLTGLPVLPADPLGVLTAFFGLWLFGLGFGLIASVVTELLPEAGKIITLLMTPLYLVSGVILPLSIMPVIYREWVLLNPIAHGLEAARLAFAPYYHAVPGLSVDYLYACAFVAVFLGLALHNRFVSRIVAQ